MFPFFFLPFIYKTKTRLIIPKADHKIIPEAAKMLADCFETNTTWKGIEFCFDILFFLKKNKKLKAHIPKKQ